MKLGASPRWGSEARTSSLVRSPARNRGPPVRSLECQGIRSPREPALPCAADTGRANGAGPWQPSAPRLQGHTLKIGSGTDRITRMIHRQNQGE